MKQKKEKDLLAGIVEGIEQVVQKGKAEVIAEGMERGVSAGRTDGLNHSLRF